MSKDFKKAFIQQVYTEDKTLHTSLDWPLSYSVFLASFGGSIPHVGTALQQQLSDLCGPAV